MGARWETDPAQRAKTFAYDLETPGLEAVSDRVWAGAMTLPIGSGTPQSGCKRLGLARLSIAGVP